MTYSPHYKHREQEQSREQTLVVHAFPELGAQAQQQPTLTKAANNTNYNLSKDHQSKSTPVPNKWYYQGSTNKQQGDTH